MWAHAQPATVEATQGAWFTIALERWFTGSVGAAAHWLDRLVSTPPPDCDIPDVQVACARLMRAGLGREPAREAVINAEEILETGGGAAEGALTPLLLCELGRTQNWLGRLDDAARSLASALHLARGYELPVLTAEALSHLAFTHFMQGNEASAIKVADEVLAEGLDPHPGTTRFASSRALLVRDLALMADLPTFDRGHALVHETDLPAHAADLTMKFWARTRRSRIELSTGSLFAAERALELPIETPKLPSRLWLALQVERMYLASLAGDVSALRSIHDQLAKRGFAAEAALAEALRADILCDARTAAARFEEAARTARLPQPPVQALALVGAAQLRDELGDPKSADEVMQRAMLATEVRRNAAPFLGWVRSGTPVTQLLDRQQRARPTSWTAEVMEVVKESPGIATHFMPSIQAASEHVPVPDGDAIPRLSPRERDVLYQLARGSTYADISVNLCISENTVKSHVASLYRKLGGSRRTEALAVARSLHLI